MVLALLVAAGGGVAAWFAADPPRQQFERTYAEVVGTVAGVCSYTEPGAANCPRLRLRVLDGTYAGRIVEADRPGGRGQNPARIEAGDRVLLGRFLQADDDQFAWFVLNRDSRLTMLLLGLLFAATLLLVGRWQGARALVGLGLSSLVLFGALLPGLAAGLPPVAVAFGGGLVALAVSMLLVHGANRTTAVAFIGAVAGLSVAAAVALIAVRGFSLLAVGPDVYASIGVLGSVSDVSGLLVAGALVATIGAIDDLCITQAAAVAELRAGRHDRRQVVAAAMRIGRDHLAAGANTLLFAAVGTALPLAVAATAGGFGAGLLLATPQLTGGLAAALVASTGVAVAMPTTTYLAAATGSWSQPPAGPAGHGAGPGRPDRGS